MKVIHGTALHVMQLLWEDGFRGAKYGLNASRLADMLGLTQAAINDALRSLRSGDRPLILESQGAPAADLPDRPSQPRRGRTSTFYSINQELVIMWPTTAAIVLQLFEHPNATGDADRFVQEIVALQWLDPFQDGRIQSVESVQRQIRFAEKRRYIERVPEHSHLLCVGLSAREEREYLTFLSRSLPTGTQRPEA